MKDKYGIATEQSATLALDHEVDQAGPGVTYDNVIIEGDRWGSSGYYPATVLERDGAKTFPAGTQVHIDHTEAGKNDSAGTIIGELAEDARYVEEADGAKVLRAPMRFYTTGIYNAAWVKERAKALGVSIRAGVTFMQGERAGRKGKIVTSFTEGVSVDVVSRAGAGGKFGMIKESARPALAEETDTRGNTMEKEERDALSLATANAVAEALAPLFTNVTTALGKVQAAQESANTPKVLTGSEIAKAIAGAKLGEKAAERVWAASESDGVDIEAKIAEEVAIRTEAIAEAQKNNGNLQFDEAGNKLDPNAQESAVAVKGWAVSE